MSTLTLIQKLSRAAIRTFSRSRGQYGLQSEEIENVKLLLNSITPADLNIDHSLLEDQTLYAPSRHVAPVTYMHIYEDSDVTICVFILKNGVTLPLHDHPDMIGILKVIHGQVKIQSYTLQSDYQGSGNLSDDLLRSNTDICLAKKNPLIRASSQSPACHLTADTQNLHEITSVGGVAAFLDILAPPYGTDHVTGIERECHYFKEIGSVNKKDTSSVYLKNIDSPKEFWCSQVDYKGPPILRASENANNGQTASI